MPKSVRRRRLENRTDYKARLALLKSYKPRLVIRKTNRYIVAQIVESDTSQDKVVISLTSKALLSKGWPKELEGSLKSLQAAYFTGFLIGRLAKNKFKEAIVDLGMYRNVKKSRLYAVVKGAIDAGLSIPASEESLPTLEEIKSNEKLAKIFDKVHKETL